MLLRPSGSPHHTVFDKVDRLAKKTGATDAGPKALVGCVVDTEVRQRSQRDRRAHANDRARMQEIDRAKQGAGRKEAGEAKSVRLDLLGP